MKKWSKAILLIWPHISIPSQKHFYFFNIWCPHILGTPYMGAPILHLKPYVSYVFGNRRANPALLWGPKIPNIQKIPQNSKKITKILKITKIPKNPQNKTKNQRIPKISKPLKKAQKSLKIPKIRKIPKIPQNDILGPKGPFGGHKGHLEVAEGHQPSKGARRRVV